MAILWRDASPGDWSTPAGYYNVDDATGMQTYMGGTDALPRGTQATMPHSGGEGNSAPVYTHDPYAGGYAMRNGQRVWDSEKPLTAQEQALIDILSPSQSYLGDPRYIFGINAGMGLRPHEAAQFFADIHKRIGAPRGAKSPTEIAEALYATSPGSTSLGTGTGPGWYNSGDWTKRILQDYFKQPQFAGAQIDPFMQQIEPMMQNWNARGQKAAMDWWERSKGPSVFQRLITSPALAMMMGPLMAGPLSAIGSAVSGAVAGTPLGSAINSISGVLSSLPAPVSGALKGAAMSGITGGNPLKGALTGGIGGLGGMAAGSLGLDPRLGSFLTKQGYGMYRQEQASDRYKQMMQQRQLARRSPFPQRTV